MTPIGAWDIAPDAGTELTDSWANRGDDASSAAKKYVLRMWAPSFEINWAGSITSDDSKQDATMCRTANSSQQSLDAYTCHFTTNKRQP